MVKNWYVLHVFLGQEQNVADYINNVLKKGPMTSYIGEIKIPTENVLELYNGKKRQVSKKIFPGYVLIELALPDSNFIWRDVCALIINIKGVCGFLGSLGQQEKPKSISPEEVRSIFQRTGEIKSGGLYSSSTSFALFETVKVNDGPFSNFTGVVEDINYEKRKVRVRVEIFGRSTPVELDFLQVEPV